LCSPLAYSISKTTKSSLDLDEILEDDPSKKVVRVNVPNLINDVVVDYTVGVKIRGKSFYDSE
jgi:hypothetical protein